MVGFFINQGQDWPDVTHYPLIDSEGAVGRGSVKLRKGKSPQQQADSLKFLITSSIQGDFQKLMTNISCTRLCVRVNK